MPFLLSFILRRWEVRNILSSLLAVGHGVAPGWLRLGQRLVTCWLEDGHREARGYRPWAHSGRPDTGLAPGFNLR